ncbi:hypothetical protein ACF3NG_09875 [Aerococcaceae bacterium WGS1372]
MNSNSVGPFLEKLRIDNELDIDIAASMLGIDAQELLLWEEGGLYPTINYVHPLAETYGVSVNEIIEGRRFTDEELNQVPHQTEEFTVAERGEEQVRSSNKLKSWISRRGEWLGAITAVFIFVIIACIALDLLSIGRISWSAITGVTIVFAWGLILPLFFRWASAIMGTLVAFSVLILPYLFILDRVIGADSLLTNVAVPITGVTIVYLWALYFMYTRLNLSLRRFFSLYCHRCRSPSLYY